MKKIEQTPIDRLNRPPLKALKFVMRAGSKDMLKHPSRMGNTLYYPDGRIVADVPPR